jgi:hypothetical protein
MLATRAPAHVQTHTNPTHAHQAHTNKPRIEFIRGEPQRETQAAIHGNRTCIGCTLAGCASHPSTYSCTDSHQPYTRTPHSNKQTRAPAHVQTHTNLIHAHHSQTNKQNLLGANPDEKKLGFLRIELASAARSPAVLASVLNCCGYDTTRIGYWGNLATSCWSVVTTIMHYAWLYSDAHSHRILDLIIFGFFPSQKRHGCGRNYMRTKSIRHGLVWMYLIKCY